MDQAAGSAPPEDAHAPVLKAMWVDVATPRAWWLALGCSASFLFLIMLLGLIGPPAFTSASDYAFLCNATQPPMPGCYEVVLPNTTVTRQYFGLSRMNQFWTMSMSLGSQDQQPRVLSGFAFTASLYGAPSTTGALVPLRTLEHASETVVCPGGAAYCNSMLVIIELFVSYPVYQVVLNFEGNSPETLDWIANIQFTFSSVNAPFTVMTIIVRVVYFALAALLAALYARRLGLFAGSTLRAWGWEQRWTFAVIVACAIYVNPFLPFDFSAFNWLLNVLSATCAVGYEIVVLSFMLLSFELIRKSYVLESRRVFYGTRVGIVVSVCTVLWIAIVVFNVEAARDPIAAWSYKAAFTNLLFFASVVWVVLLIYILVTLVWAGTTIRAFPTQNIRYSFFSFVSAVYLVCVTIAAMTANYRPRDATGFLFFTTLRVWLAAAFVVGYWPLDVRGHASLAPITNSHASNHVPLAEAAPILAEDNDERARRFQSDRNPFA